MMGTYAKTTACALLVVFICAVSNGQSQFSANTTGKSDKAGWAGGDPESTKVVVIENQMYNDYVMITCFQTQ